MSVCDNIVVKNLKKSRDGYQINLYTMFHLKDGMGIEFISELMPDSHTAPL